MKKKKMMYLLVSSLAITLTASLSSCANGEAKKWAYTKDEMSDFIELGAVQTNNSDNTITFSTDLNVEIFDENIDKDDVIVFDKDKVKEELEKSNKEYADYSVLKKASVEVVNVHNLDTKDGFDITFKGDQNANYGMLLYSKVTVVDKFTSVSRYQENINITDDPQATFEENYVSSEHISWEKGGKMITTLITNYAVTALALSLKNPFSFVSGMSGIFSTIFDTVSEKGTSIGDVMNKLKDVDKKIDDLSNKIDRNTQILQDEIVSVNANVDQANLNILNISINDFANNAIAPINNFNRNMEDEVGNYYKKFISEPQTIKLALESNSEDKYYSVPLHEINDTSKYNFQLVISDFTNAKAFLAANDNIVKSGFVGELEKDIDNALALVSNLPYGISTKDYNQFVRSRIIENFSKEYYSTHKDKAQEYRNLMIQFSERIVGINGKVNYLNTYLSRLQYMYNFQAEIKPLVRSFCVNLLKILDANTTLAMQACHFAEYNYDELSNIFKTTRDEIQNCYKTTNNVSDSYSFITGTILTGSLYTSKYYPKYTNPGNHPNFSVDFETIRYGTAGMGLKSFKDDISKHNGISEASHLKISTRWNLLRNVGATSSGNDYAHYLASNNAIIKEAMQATDIFATMKFIDGSNYRILTSNRIERDLNSSDSLGLLCVSCGNGNYFTINVNYTYRGHRDRDYWSGRTFEGTFISGSSGTSLGTQKICSWAKYAEDHWYWSTDEYWAFADYREGFYILVESVR